MDQGKTPPLLEVRDLRVSFRDRRTMTSVVHGVGFRLRSGDTLAEVGESGSGKSVTCLALTGPRLQPPACHFARERHLSDRCGRAKNAILDVCGVV